MWRGGAARRRYFKKYFEVRTALDEQAILNDLDPALQQEVTVGGACDLFPRDGRSSGAVRTTLDPALRQEVNGNGRWRACVVPS